MPLIDFGRLNLPLKAKYLMAKFHAAVMPTLRLNKATRFVVLLSYKFPIFQKTI